MGTTKQNLSTTNQTRTTPYNDFAQTTEETELGNQAGTRLPKHIASRKTHSTMMVTPPHIGSKKQSFVDSNLHSL